MQLTEEQQLIQDMAKSFAQEQIKPFARAWISHCKHNNHPGIVP